MPNHKSCAKRMKTSEKQRVRNRSNRSVLRQAVRELRLETNKESAQTKLTNCISLLDQASQKHLIHPRNAARNKSRLTIFVNKMA